MSNSPSDTGLTRWKHGHDLVDHIGKPTTQVLRVGWQPERICPGAPRYLALLDEAVLRRPLGGVAAMAEQVSHIVQLAKRPNITVQVIPFAHGAHPALHGSFALFEFAKAATIVHIEHRRGSMFLDGHADTLVFQETIDTLRGTALDPGESLEFLASVAAENN